MMDVLNLRRFSPDLLSMMPMLPKILNSKGEIIDRVPLILLEETFPQEEQIVSADTFDSQLLLA